MLVTVAGIEELVGVATKVAQAFHLVLYGMRVNDVHNHGHAILVSRVNEFLQFFGSSETARRCKERRDVIAKRAIIGMFLYSHHLNAVVSILDDTRQHIVLKLRIGSNLFCILPHAYVTLINEQRALLGLEVLFLEFVFLLWIPNLCREYLCVIVLNHAAAPCRNAFAFATIPTNLHLVEVAVLHGLFRQLQFPVARALNALALVFV